MKLLSVFLLLSSFQIAGAAEKWRIAVHEVPPHSCEKCPENGGGIKALREALKSENIEAEFVFLPYVRATKDGADGDFIGYFPEWPNDLPKDTYLSSEAIFESTISFIHDSKKVLNWKTLADLKGKKIGTIRGWTYGDEFSNMVKNKTIEIDEAEDDAKNIKKCIAGRIDAAIVDVDIAKALLKTDIKDLAGKVTIQTQAVTKFLTVMGIRKDIPNAADKVAKLNRALKKIDSMKVQTEYIKANY